MFNASSFPHQFWYKILQKNGKQNKYLYSFVNYLQNMYHVQSHNYSQNMRVSRSDALIKCNLMDSRCSFLNLARNKHYEFSSMRRAKYSTLCLLYEIHSQLEYNCKKCGRLLNISRYHCNVCGVSIYEIYL